MAAPQSLTDQIDRVIEDFNARRMDLPDGFFDRKTQFVINGAPFETLLSSTPADALVMMLARGPAGYRFSAKALQHAIPDARLERGEVVFEDPSRVLMKLWLSGKLRGGGASINALVDVTLIVATDGHIEIANAHMDPIDLGRIRDARLLP